MSLQRMGKYRFDGSKLPPKQFQSKVFVGLEVAMKNISRSETLWKNYSITRWNKNLKSFIMSNRISVHEPYLIAMGVMKGVYVSAGLSLFDFNDRWEKDKTVRKITDYIPAKRRQFIQDYYKPSVIQGTPKRIRNCV